MTFLRTKRLNRDLLEDKNLGSLPRFYKISGVSYLDQGMVAVYSQKQEDHNPVDYLDLTGFMSAMIDSVDTWVSSGHAQTD